jgi:hypothetical protein
MAPKEFPKSHKNYLDKISGTDGAPEDKELTPLDKMTG